MPVLICFFVLLFLAGDTKAQSQDWQQLKRQSQKLRYTDPAFALLKLQKAWEILAAKSSTFASRALRDDVMKTYGEIDYRAQERLAKLTEQEFQLFMQKDSPDKWFGWKITRTEDALILSVDKSWMSHYFGVSNGLLVREETEKAIEDRQRSKALDNFYKTSSAKNILHAFEISSKNEKYDDLLALSAPLKVGQSKAVTFDINAFVPQRFQQIKSP